MANIISIVSYPFLPARAGGEKNVALFNKYLSAYHRLICITTKRNDPAQAKEYEVLGILSNAKFRYVNLFYFFLVKKIIRQNKVTHIILEHPYYGWLGYLLKTFCHVKLIVHSHNIEGLRWKTLGKWWWKILWTYEKLTHRKADFNFFIQDEDKKYAIENFGLNSLKCITVTYGIERKSIPPAEEKLQAKKEIRALHNIPPANKILLFNGAFKYKPNLDALKKITGVINPLLQQAKEFEYTIIICGMDIPDEIVASGFPNIVIAGFVENISQYLKGADVFLNPVNEGGGIKTKLVEALGYNLNAVSTRHGAIGINPDWCNNKLQICENNDWKTFVEWIVKLSSRIADTPDIYFEHFYLGGIVQKATEFIDQI